MSEPNLDQWSKEQLLAELRHRQRRGASPARAAGAATGLHAELRDVPTSRLAAALKDRQRVVYGTDDRQDLFAVKSKKVRGVADAVAALVKAADLRATAGGFELRTTSYQEEFELCGNEPFVGQPLGCFCSGFLVAPDVIATAGHCVKSAADLAGLRFVFGFRMKDAAVANTTFGPDDVYEGKEIIGRQMVGDGPDWALVRLKRAVVGRTPLAVRTSGKIGSKQGVFVIGHPNGLPAKYAPKAKVRDNTPGSLLRREPRHLRRQLRLAGLQLRHLQGRRDPGAGRERFRVERHLQRLPRLSHHRMSGRGRDPCGGVGGQDSEIQEEPQVSHGQPRADLSPRPRRPRPCSRPRPHGSGQARALRARRRRAAHPRSADRPRGAGSVLSQRPEPPARPRPGPRGRAPRPHGHAARLGGRGRGLRSHLGQVPEDHRRPHERSEARPRRLAPPASPHHQDQRPLQGLPAPAPGSRRALAGAAVRLRLAGRRRSLRGGPRRRHPRLGAGRARTHPRPLHGRPRGPPLHPALPRGVGLDDATPAGAAAEAAS